MASFRTARVLAAVAALPLAAALFTGSASADGLVDDGSNASVAAIVGSGVLGNGNSGNSTTTQQVATGPGASNENSTASVNGSGFTVIDQSKETVAVNFVNLW
ncbi:hypothetical protein [Streptomyces sp. NBC_01506]|uniref:hypothetical protein n=1 Tax=Streptomyces sp. NBC_01506 TaxID=2903887 RepID=UPI00386458B8